MVLVALRCVGCIYRRRRRYIIIIIDRDGVMLSFPGYPSAAASSDGKGDSVA